MVLAPSFADIFASNAVTNGLLAARIDEPTLAGLAARVEATPGYRLTVDLDTETLRGSDGFEAAFAVDAETRRRLLEGLDDIGLILRHEAAIRRYESAHRPA